MHRVLNESDIGVCWIVESETTGPSNSVLANRQFEETCWTNVGANIVYRNVDAASKTKLTQGYKNCTGDFFEGYHAAYLTPGYGDGLTQSRRLEISAYLAGVVQWPSYSAIDFTRSLSHSKILPLHDNNEACFVQFGDQVAFYGVES